MTKLPLVAAALAAAALTGCAGTHGNVAAQATPTPSTSASTAGAAGAEGGSEGHSRYVVKKGDSLWKIAGRNDVLGDSFRWPLLFRSNRDQIQDPDFLSVDLDLSYRTNYSADEIADAVKKADATPAFQPHKRPRKVLPIQY